MTSWCHSRIDNPFAARNEWAAIAHDAVLALARREDSYPTQIDQQLIDKATAYADIAAWRAIVDDWNWISAGPAETVAGVDFSTHFRKIEASAQESLPARVIALDTAIDRFFENYDHALKGGSPKLISNMRKQITLLAAMRSWAEVELHKPRHSQARFFASIGHEFRARRADYAIHQQQGSIAA